MSFKSIISALVKAAPVLIANAPAIIAVVKNVKRATKKTPAA